MPFLRPTLTELRTQVASDITAGLKTVDGLLRFSNLGVLGTSVAGMSHLHYAYLDWIALQSNPYTATGEYLEAWAGLKKIYREAATYAVLSVTWSGTKGTVLPAGTEVTRADGVTYTTLADGTVGSAGTVTVSVTASDSGTDSNAEVGTQVSLGSAVTGIQSTGAVVEVVTEGTAQELDAALRTRMLKAYQSTARGGSQSDYESWALDATGVTRAWVNPIGAGAGTVVVYVMMDTANSANGGFPQGSDGVSPSDTRATSGNSATGDQLAVVNSIFTVRPVTALVYVCAPIAAPIDFVISGLTVTDTLKASIAAAISLVMLDEGEPLPGSSLDLSAIEAAIAAISGTEGFVIESPTGNIANSLGYLPTLGDVTYE